MASDVEIKLTSGDQSLILFAPLKGGPLLRYWGSSSAESEVSTPADKILPASPDLPVPNGLFPLLGAGFFGEPALTAHSQENSFFQIDLETCTASEKRAELTYTEEKGQFSLVLEFELCAGSGMLSAKAYITNLANASLHIGRLHALSLPLPDWAYSIHSAYGSWSNEHHWFETSLVAGKIERASRSGRPGFDGGPFLLISSEDTNEHHGNALGISLAHSGNFVIAAERLGDGRSRAFAAEWLHAGEICLRPGDTYRTPEALVAWSEEGTSGVQKRFHTYARSVAPATRCHRPVQFNTWEAVYFNVDQATAVRLARDAADLGAERFVLDDGWFKDRNDDRTSLGDWTPDTLKFPNGLTPLADEVEALGMEFGLWVEPEMVNEDSDLFRAHPDWILSVDGWPQYTGRHQLVLDLSREDVRSHLFACLDSLLSSLPIRYLKWDCNRDLYPAASVGTPAAHAQIDGVYRLMDDLRKTHPSVSIESCASGGGRMDFGILRRTDRFWPSDATDAIERVRIQRGAARFFPLEMLGAHVGPSPNPLTRRRLSMAFRCFVALFGHFGIELDPAELSEADQSVLRRAVELFKTLRSQIINGQLKFLEMRDSTLDVQAVVSADKKSVLVRVLRLSESARSTPERIRLSELRTGTEWAVTEHFLVGSEDHSNLGVFTAEFLQSVGLDLAPLHAATGRLFQLTQV